MGRSSMDLGICDSVAMVFGAGGGLGGGIATALAAEGASVAACDINTEALSALAVRQRSGRLLPVETNVADCDSLDNAVDRVRSELGPISILVNITGGPPPSTAEDVSPADWRTHFDSMVVGVMHVTGLVLSDMREHGWGRVITSTSSGVVCPIANLVVSNALRSALIGWSKTLATEVARDGITVNAVIPGRIYTDRIASLDHARAKRENRTQDEVVAASVASIPAGRYGNIEEYASAVSFIASRQASFITGSVIRVDGGMIPSIY